MTYCDLQFERLTLAAVWKTDPRETAEEQADRWEAIAVVPLRGGGVRRDWIQEIF